jgi:hypothetical protein
MKILGPCFLQKYPKEKDNGIAINKEVENNSL